MNRQQIQEIILRVLAECGEAGDGWGAGDSRGVGDSRELGTGRRPGDREVPIDIPVEVSAKHVHLNREAVEKLFGPGAELTPRRPLSQPGQFLSEERVTLLTPKGRIENVAVLGPVRDAVQTELAVTDCRALGIDAPLRMSGDLSGAADVYLMGPKGMIEAKGSVIVAQAHVHLTPQDAERAGVTDGQSVSVTIRGKRQTTFEQVICRVSSQAALAMHIDFDEANACLLPKSATARMRITAGGGAIVGGGAIIRGDMQRKPTEQGKLAEPGKPAEPGKLVEQEEPGKSGAEEDGFEVWEPLFEGNLITEAVARRLAAGRKTPVVLAKDVIITPSAKDVLRHAGIDVMRQTGPVRQAGQPWQVLQDRQPRRYRQGGGGL